MTRVIPSEAAVSGWTTEQQQNFRAQHGDEKADSKRVYDGSHASKENYLEVAKQAYDIDRAKYSQLLRKREKMLEIMRLRPFIGKDKLFERVKDLDQKMAALQADMEYNRMNINRSNPTSYLPPSIPAPPNQFYVCEDALLMCPCATPPNPFGSVFKVDPSRSVFLYGKRMGNVGDIIKEVNIPCMGFCFPTTTVCATVTPAPWMPGKTNVLIQGKPALLSTDTLQCVVGAGRIIVLPMPSPMSGAGKQAMKEMAQGGVEKLLKKIKFLKKVPGMGIAIGVVLDGGQYVYKYANGEAVENDYNSEKMFNDWKGYWDDPIRGIDNLGQMVCDVGKLSAAHTSGKLGGGFVGGLVGAVEEGLVEGPAMVVDVVVGTGESLGSGASVYLIDDSFYDDSDVFINDDESFYYNK